MCGRESRLAVCHLLLQVRLPYWKTLNEYGLLPNGRQSNDVRRFKKVNSNAMSALGMKTGLSHMEWFQTDNGSVISEVGARPPGVNIMPMLSIAHGVNMWEKWAELMVFGRWKMPRRKCAVGCAFLRAQGRGRRIVEIVGLDEVLDTLGDTVALARLHNPVSLGRVTTRVMVG